MIEVYNDLYLQVTTDGFAHHGILAHQDDGMASKRDTDLLHLLRSDIVSIDLRIRKEYE